MEVKATIFSSNTPPISGWPGHVRRLTTPRPRDAPAGDPYLAEKMMTNGGVVGTPSESASAR